MAMRNLKFIESRTLRWANREGWRGYRYGATKPVTLPRIFTGEARKAKVSTVMKVLRDWRLSPFEMEGPVRAGIRSALCMDGHGWHRADAEAEALVAEALHLIGAIRPTWEQGQREYAIGRDYCLYCRGPLDEEEIARHRKFCSTDCAGRYMRTRDDEASVAIDQVRSHAYYLVRTTRFPPKPCGWCGKVFQPAVAGSDACSIGCREKLLISRIPKRECDQCGKLYQPVKTFSTYCSEECRTDHKNEKRNAESVARRAPRPCDHCGESYTPSKANQMYCGPRCKGNALYARNGWVVMKPKPCVECGTMFTPKKRNTQEYCSSKCQIRVWARRRREKANAAKQASTFTCEECPPVSKAA